MKEQARRPRFLIMSPPQADGGPIVLHLLCRMLADLGYDAKIFRMRIDGYIPVPYTRQDLLQRHLPFMNKKGRQLLDSQEGHVKGCELTVWPYVDDDTIVVYPEIIFGNPLAAKHVVRWFLYYNRFKEEIDGVPPYGKDDLFICYRAIFNDYALNPTCREVGLSHFDHDLYKRWNYGHREGNCFIVRKGFSRPDLPATLPGIILDDLPEEEKVAVMNRCQYCYSYDTQTFYSNVAAVCGCVSIVVPEPGKRREDYLSGEEKGWGIAYGTSPEELEFARETYKKLEERIEGFEADNRENVRKFLAYCREHFEGRMDAGLHW